MNFAESTLSNEIFKNMLDHGISWGSNYGEIMVKLAVESFASYLGEVKADTPKAIVVKNDDKSKIVFAAIVEKSDSEAGKGYTLSYTFDESSIPENADIVTVEDSIANSIINKIAESKFHMRFHTIAGENINGKVFSIIFSSIKEYLRNNVGVDPVITIPDFVTFEASVVDDKLHISITPDPVLKQVVKDDTTIEQQEETPVAWAQ